MASTTTPSSAELACLVVCLLATACAGSPDASSTRAVEDAIVNGELPKEGAALTTVALLRQPRPTTSCSGVLVAGDLVVTAAHCVAEVENEPSALTVIAGAPDVGVASEAEKYAVDRVDVHPGFPGPPSEDPTSLGSRYDIAVLLLARSVQNANASPLLTRERAAELLVPGAELAIAGFGSTDREGSSKTGVLRDGSVVVDRTGDHELLAGGPDSGDTCFGDSGGPAFVGVDGRAWLAGITSRARQDGASPCGEGTIFEIASSHADFLESAGVSADIDAAARPDAANCSVPHPGRTRSAGGPLLSLAAGALLRRVARRERNRRRSK